MEGASKSDVVKWQREDMMMESVIMEEVHDVIKGYCNVEG